MVNDYFNYAKEETNLQLEIENGIHVIEDKSELNIFKTEEKYRIYDLDSMDDGKQVQLATSMYLDLPVSTNRNHPILILLDGEMTHDVEVIYKKKPPKHHEEKLVNNSWFNYVDSVNVDRNKFLLSAKITPKKMIVDTKDISAYAKDVEQLRLRSVNSFSYKLGGGNNNPPELTDKEVAKMLFWIVIVIILVAVRFV